jgi:hypothetical protein
MFSCRSGVVRCVARRRRAVMRGYQTTSLSLAATTLHNITPTDRQAFQLCVPREQSEKLLDASRWPAHVTITDYFFSKNKKPTTTPSTRLRRQSDDHDEHRLDSATSESHHSMTREKPLEASRPPSLSSASSIIYDPVDAAVAASGSGTPAAEDT